MVLMRSTTAASTWMKHRPRSRCRGHRAERLGSVEVMASWAPLGEDEANHVCTTQSLSGGNFMAEISRPCGFAVETLTGEGRGREPAERSGVPTARCEPWSRRRSPTSPSGRDRRNAWRFRRSPHGCETLEVSGRARRRWAATDWQERNAGGIEAGGGLVNASTEFSAPHCVDGFQVGFPN
jgi:hypothetical protein